MLKIQTLPLTNDVIYGNIHLVARQGNLVATTGNEFTQYQMSLPVDFDLDPIAVPFQPIKKLKWKTCKCLVVDNRLRLINGSNQIDIEPIKEFPRYNFTKFNTVSFETAYLKNLVKVLSLGEDDTVHFYDDIICTNKKVYVRVKNEFLKGFAVKLSELASILKLVKSDVIQVGLSDNELYFEFDDLKVKTRLLKVNQPNELKIEGDSIDLVTPLQPFKETIGQFTALTDQIDLILDDDDLTCLGTSQHTKLESILARQGNSHGLIKLPSKQLKSLLDVLSGDDFEGEIVTFKVNFKDFNFLRVISDKMLILIAGMVR